MACLRRPGFFSHDSFAWRVQFDHAPTLARLSDALDEVLYEFEAAGAFKRGDLTFAVTNGKKYSSWLSFYGKNEVRGR